MVIYNAALWSVFNVGLYRLCNWLATMLHCFSLALLSTRIQFVDRRKFCQLLSVGYLSSISTIESFMLMTIFKVF